MRSNGHGVPIVALDIDGTLGDFHTHFLRFAEQWTGQKMPPVYEPNFNMPLWDHMRVTQQVYRECKLAFRQGGLKRFMPVYDGAAELAQGIRDLGAEVWICTTRPYLRLDNIDPDTREWLRRNGIVYDAVLFDRLEEKGSKYEELWRQSTDRTVACVFDDLPEMCAAANASGFRVAMRDAPYNREAGYFRVHSCWEMLDLLKNNKEWFDVQP